MGLVTAQGKKTGLLLMRENSLVVNEKMGRRAKRNIADSKIHRLTPFDPISYTAQTTAPRQISQIGNPQRRPEIRS